jgi:alcohol dehydrogenase (cytochrome c)
MNLFRSWRGRICLSLALAAAALAGLALSVEALRWRTQVLLLKTLGQVEGLGWTDLLAMLRPGSAVRLEGLVETPNAYAVILNPHISAVDRANGALLFAQRCTACHGEAGQGQSAPALVNRTLKMGDADWSLFQTISDGRLDLGMPPSGLSDTETWQVVGHLRNLRNGSTALSDEGAPASPTRIHVSSSRLENAAAEPQNWLMYSGSYSSWRYSPLDDIRAENVTELKLAWSLQLGTTAEYVETTPLVVDGMMYLTTPESDVFAVNAATGEVVWKYSSDTPKDVPTCCGDQNRGVAVLHDRVFIGTLDTHVVALDAHTGAVLWENEVADYKAGYSMTAAPLAIGDKIIVGIAGGEFGIRGFLDAYDPATGRRIWRFYTIPEPGQPGSETWQGDAWKIGGGPTWVTGSYDVELGIVYWGVGNPSPDFNGDVRPGDNLFTNSVIALDENTGQLKWHFQFTPHDEHDWDSNQVPVLIDHEFEGRPRKLILWANRNGFFYVLDRVTGEFLHARAFVKQTWADGMDERGRPILSPTAAPSRLGTLTWPGLSGGGNWWSPSYDPNSDSMFVPFAEAPKVFFKNAEVGDLAPVPNRQFLGSASMPTGEPLQAGIRALDPVTGEVKWEYLRLRPQRNVGRIGGVLSTAGNVVFFGDLKDFVAYDATHGRELWRVNLGGHINASPMSFAIDGEQRVAIAAGNALFVFRR